MHGHNISPVEDIKDTAVKRPGKVAKRYAEQSCEGHKIYLSTLEVALPLHYSTWGI